MKIRNESEWQQWLAELATDEHPLTPHFREFVVTWAEKAEEILDQWPQDLPTDALNLALEATEIAVGWTPTGMLGQALVVLGTHWGVTDPEAFYDHLTPIERHLYAEMAAMKVAQLQEAAAETTAEGDQ